MASAKVQLTDKEIALIPFAEDVQYDVRDDEVTGFFLRVGKRKKTFMAKGEFWREGVRELRLCVKIGEVGDITAREARAKAKDIVGGIARGRRPGEEGKTKSSVITLRGAWEKYRDAHMIRKGRSPGTIANYRDHMERLLGDWLDLPIGRLGRRPVLVVERHEKITAENGAYIANGAMRSLRAVYNHSRRSHRDLPPENPVSAVDWNLESRRNSGMAGEAIAKWLIELSKLDNPIRREFHLLTLLSGSRPTALKTIKIEHIDLRRRLIHIPKPKGGVDKAFDIPLSRAMMKSILRAIRLGRSFYPEQAVIWLFPADSTSGHIVEHKEDRADLTKWGNDLRQSYRTVAQIASVSELDVHLLMNHSVRGVNAGYITRDALLAGHLRKQQERISQTVEASARLSGSVVAQWLQCTKVRLQPPSARSR